MTALHILAMLISFAVGAGSILVIISTLRAYRDKAIAALFMRHIPTGTGQ